VYRGIVPASPLALSSFLLCSPLAWPSATRCTSLALVSWRWHPCARSVCHKSSSHLPTPSQSSTTANDLPFICLRSLSEYAYHGLGSCNYSKGNRSLRTTKTKKTSTTMLRNPYRSCYTARHTSLHSTIAAESTPSRHISNLSFCIKLLSGVSSCHIIINTVIINNNTVIIIVRSCFAYSRRTHSSTSARNRGR